MSARPRVSSGTNVRTLDGDVKFLPLGLKIPAVNPLIMKGEVDAGSKILSHKR